MNKLSFYEGSALLSFAFDSKQFKLPYVYTDDLFGGSFSKAHFYKDLFNLAANELGVDLNTCEIYTMGLFDEPETPFVTVKSTGSLFDNLTEECVFIAPDIIATKGSVQSFDLMEIGMDPDNFLANTYLYPNLVYTDTRDISRRDGILRAVLTQTEIPTLGDKVIVTGDRLENFDNNKPLSYLLLFDVLKNPGIFNVRLDKNNMFPHITMLGLSEESYSVMGTLVNSPGETECLYKTDVGTSQLIKLEAEKLFILPLEKDEKASVLIKNKEGQVEQTVSGGELGVVLDTRAKADKKDFNEIHIDAIIQAFNRI